jgi:hypothetical protein
MEYIEGMTLDVAAMQRRLTNIFGGAVYRLLTLL